MKSHKLSRLIKEQCSDCVFGIDSKDCEYQLAAVKEGTCRLKKLTKRVEEKTVDCSVTNPEIPPESRLE